MIRAFHSTSGMHKRFTLTCCFVFMTMLPLSVEATSLWIEAESFAIPGHWLRSGIYIQGRNDGNTNRAREDIEALTVVDVPKAGRYRLWVRARDYDYQPATRKFALELNGVRAATEFGTHREDGWRWQDGGVFELPAGELQISALDTSSFYARFDKLLLTTRQDFKPTGVGARENVQHKQPEILIDYEYENSDFVFQDAAAAKFDATQPGAATIANERYELRFITTQIKGSSVVLPALFLKSTGTLVADPRWNYFVYLFNDANIAQPGLDRTHWPTFSPVGVSKLGSIERSGRLLTENPFHGATVKRYFYPERIISSSSTHVDLETSNEHFDARFTYSLKNGHPHVDLELTAKQDGFATIGAYFSAPRSKEETSFFLLPYYHQARRFPESISLTASCYATAPLALAESKLDGVARTSAMVADLSQERFEFLSYNQSFAAFAIYNEQGQVQPGLFAPVPATDDYACTAGETLQLKCYWYANDLAWNEAFDEVVFQLVGLRDYRKNYKQTLTETANNIIDLAMNAEHGGWSLRHKGFVQIEGENMVTHASLLTMMQAYYLTGDEKIYDALALPTAEFFFSRLTKHFPTHPTRFGRWVDAVYFDGPMQLYGTSTFHGFHEMYRGRAPVFYHDALTPDGRAKSNTGYNSIPRFSEELYAYRLTGESKFLERAKQLCRQYVNQHILKAPTNPFSYGQFVKLRLAPYFWALVDMYEETQEKWILDAAVIAADMLLTTIYVHPLPSDDTYEVDRDNILALGEEAAWWRLERRYRLGYNYRVFESEEGPPPLFAPIGDHITNPESIDEGPVPAWVVSPAGLTIEAPTTFTRWSRVARSIDRRLYPIRLNNECAYLMRLYGLTKEQRYWTYARNGVLGQGNNYPGYYANHMSTTEREAKYPYEGPDLSSIYYHHIPPHLAMVIDFLITSADVRSNGAVRFPSVLQQGYVWFTNRMYGHAPGKFYGDSDVHLTLARDLITLDTYELNYVMGVSKDAFYLFLMNEADKAIPVSVALNETRLQISEADGPVELTIDNGSATKARMADGRVRVRVPKKGVAALKFDGVTFPGDPRLSASTKRAALDKLSFVRVEDKHLGRRIQAVLLPHPLHDRFYDAFVNTDGLDDKSITLHYSTDGEQTWKKTRVADFPYEATVRVDEIDAPFAFYIERTDVNGAKHRSETRTLRLKLR